MIYQEILEREYGIHVRGICRTQGGWSAEAWRVEADEGCFFLKAYDASRPSVLPWIERMTKYVPAMRLLQDAPDLGKYMPRLLPTTDGESSVRADGHVFLMFEYIEGEVPGERALTNAEEKELAEIFAALHQVKIDRIPCEALPDEEDIAIPFCDALADALKDMDKLPERMKETLSPWREVLLTASEKTLMLKSKVRSRMKTLCMCHTDAHNWNLICADRLYLLDWEGLCLAPPEADLYAFAADGTLMKHYLELRPGFRLNEQLMLFYTLRRRLEDIWAFMDRLSREQLETEAEEASYRFIREAAVAAEQLIR